MITMSRRLLIGLTGASVMIATIAPAATMSPGVAGVRLMSSRFDRFVMIGPMASGMPRGMISSGIM